MLEKIGLPAKPSLRGNTWVVDASHCQGCSSQFTFINRKHHCRRCGGLFCGSCTQQRMFLRGQGDSPVRICEPCKKLEEAARFELRHGYKNRSAKGSSKTIVKEDDVLSEILSTDGDVSSSSTSMASRNDCASPEELRQLAVEEKKKYRVLKGEGKSEEALRAFKRGKELERQADALEISLRRSKRRAHTLNKSAAEDTNKTQKPLRQSGKEKDEFADELKELGWCEDEHKKPTALSLEGEFSSLLREVPLKTNRENSHGIDKTQVIALKKNALKLKREGKLAEAKEELKKAKLLERQIEEQELLAGADDSDDELAAIIRSMDDDDKDDDLLGQYETSHGDFDIGNVVGNVDNLEFNGDFDVTDEDMIDPEISAALKSMGWTEDSGECDDARPQRAATSREERLAEIQSLKREALNLKRAGDIAEAMATLKKAKLLEKELEGADTSSSSSSSKAVAHADLGPKAPRRSRLAVQRELLAVKKKALTLRREGRLDEAEEEMKKGTILQNELDELDNPSKSAVAGKTDNSPYDDDDDDDEGDVEVKDEDLEDPAYISTLKSLGWDDENTNKSADSSLEASDSVSKLPKRSKLEIQRELLGLKRKALALRRQGNDDEADEVLKQTRILEAQMKEMDSDKNPETAKEAALSPVLKNAGEERITQSKSAKSRGNIQREVLDLKRKALLLRREGRIGEAEELLRKATVLEAEMAEFESPENNDEMMDVCSNVKSEVKGSQNYSDIPSSSAKTKIDHAEISQKHSRNAMNNDKDSDPESVLNVSPQSSQHSLKQEILAHKRKALALKREGKITEAKEALQQAKALEKVLEGENSPPQQVPAKQPSASSSSPSSDPKPLSGRDRFKIQQESLSHKRQAMKLRREGRMEEAEAELELAKTLEAKLEESSKPEAEKDDVVVEDFLDPQLLSALRSIGLDDSMNPEATKGVKESDGEERSRLEERVKAEKVKAVTLKRAGKQAEALDCLRRAKLYEKKLNSLASN